MQPAQQDLFATGDPAIAPLRSGMRRDLLDADSWVDLVPGWVHGADALLAELVETARWQHRTRPMYGSIVEEPRLSATLELARAPAVIGAAARALSDHYGVRFDRVWCNYYRNGSDSVAWHADRVGKAQARPLVVIVSLGGPRTFALRPRGGGRARRYRLHSGDLLVMGGRCQHAYEHAVPKVAQACPRVSVTLRHGPEAPEPVRSRTRLAVT